MNYYRSLVAALFLSCCAATLSARGDANSFADIIRKTEPLSPEQEQKAFHLPPGFEIQLVVAEPDIAKPINMAFDSQGRLWLSQSKEYPFPAPTNRPARDAIKILSDFGKAGRAGKITTFASGLNIPIGIYPYKDGALGYSIPYIYHFRDTNGDSVADTREVFLGRFGFDRDTHGMTGSFRRGYDGWLYANHGFNNTSTLTAKDGSSITMNSGNTYRIKIDGSHIEQFAWGRVNPFGMMFDPLGNIYSSDCETFPIYQMLRGGYYPSFGKPDDGLGFAPAMMDHKHGSTAIAGTVFYAATNFPPEFRDNIFVGNVMTCRIDRDSLEHYGSTSIAREQPDFLSCDDPWFRPVDLQLGPDGAIYMADFYNRIIGHYEVPLDNPGRDRERGRIWRIVYTGATHELPQEFDLSRASTSRLIKQLGNSNLTIRMLAMNELTDRVGAEAVKPVIRMMEQKKSSVWQKIQGLWVLYRANSLPPQMLAEAANDPDARLRVHAVHVYSEIPSLTSDQHDILLAALHDTDALVERNAADALGQHPDAANIRPLLDALQAAPKDDTHLIYVLRMSLRNQLRAEKNYAGLPLPSWTATDDADIADVSMAVPSSASAAFILHHLQNYDENHDTAARFLRHAARYLPESSLTALVDFTRKKFADDFDFQLDLFKSIQDGLAQRGATLSAEARQWGEDLARSLLVSTNEPAPMWRNIPIPGNDPTNPWSLQTRLATNGKNEKFISSLPTGEKYTGILRSRPFPIPPRLIFNIAGHDGYPGKPAYEKNFIRLIDNTTHEVLKRTPAPRNDASQRIAWDLSALVDKTGYLEIADGDTDDAYAWIAVGFLHPQVVSLPDANPNDVEHRQQFAAELAGSLHLTSLEEPLAKLLADGDAPYEGRAAAAKALMAINPAAHAAALGTVLANDEEPSVLRNRIAQALAEVNVTEARLVLLSVLANAPQTVQAQIALALASTPDGAEALLEAVENGKASARLLQDRNLKERLTSAKPANLEARLTKLTERLPPADVERQKLIDSRALAFNRQTASAAHGAELFQKNCVVCHSINGHGGAVGPNLDGIGNRGIPRVVEDILDPSRNVDRAFRVTLFTLQDGDVQSGLFRREEGEMVVFADSTGKESSIPKKDIASRRESVLSLMPDNFSELISPKDFNDLLAFLTAKSQKDEAKK